MSRVWFDRRWTTIEPLARTAPALRGARPSEEEAVVVRKNRTGFEIVEAGHYRRGEFEIVRAAYHWKIQRAGLEIGQALTLHDAQVEVRRRALESNVVEGVSPA